MTTPKNALRRLLTGGLAYAAEYRGGLSNHFPMACIALDRIGGTEEEVESFASFYRDRLEPLEEPGDVVITPGTWRERLGEHRYNAEYRAFFTSELRRLGREALLQSYVPALMPGVAGGAFHPLIRLAYALEARHDGELAEALASWSIAFLPIGTPGGALEPLAGLETVAASAELRSAKLEGSVIFEKLQYVGALEAFSDVGGLPLGTTVANLREAVLAVYEGSGANFIALHLMTSLHALRVVDAEVGLRGTALAHYWRGAAAAYLTIGAPTLKIVTLPDEPLPTWAAITAIARQSKDDHVIKFVHTCASEEAAYDDARYRLLAARKVKLL